MLIILAHPSNQNKDKAKNPIYLLKWPKIELIELEPNIYGYISLSIDKLYSWYLSGTSKSNGTERDEAILTQV